MFTITPVRSLSTPAFSLDGKPVHGAQAVRLDGDYRLLWTSGQVAPKGPDGSRGPVEEQIRQVLDQLRDVVQSGGGKLTDVVKLMAWLPRREDVALYADIRRGYFGDASPASTSVISQLVEPDMLIEIEAIVAVPLDAPTP